MNPNSKKPGHLFFTPRTPWGTRAGQQSFRQHQRASEDSKTAEKKALDQMKEQAGYQKWMDQNNVPRGLQSQITPERAEEMHDASVQLPPYDVKPVTDMSVGTAQPKPGSAPQAAADPRVVRRAPTEEEKRQLERSGGLQGAIVPPQAAPPQGLRLKPSFSKNSFGVEGSLSW